MAKVGGKNYTYLAPSFEYFYWCCVSILISARVLIYLVYDFNCDIDLFVWGRLIRQNEDMWLEMHTCKASFSATYPRKIFKTLWMFGGFWERCLARCQIFTPRNLPNIRNVSKYFPDIRGWKGYFACTSRPVSFSFLQICLSHTNTNQAQNQNHTRPLQGTDLNSDTRYSTRNFSPLVYCSRRKYLYHKTFGK